MPRACNKAQPDSRFLVKLWQNYPKKRVKQRTLCMFLCGQLLKLVSFKVVILLFNIHIRACLKYVSVRRRIVSPLCLARRFNLCVGPTFSLPSVDVDK